jgi:hypothetical protein
VVCNTCLLLLLAAGLLLLAAGLLLLLAAGMLSSTPAALRASGGTVHPLPSSAWMHRSQPGNHHSSLAHLIGFCLALASILQPAMLPMLLLASPCGVGTGTPAITWWVPMLGETAGLESMTAAIPAPNSSSSSCQRIDDRRKRVDPFVQLTVPRKRSRCVQYLQFRA